MDPVPSVLFGVWRLMGDTPNMTQYTETGCNLDKKRTDVYKEEVIVTELRTSFNNNSKHILLSLY
jgi:hypothetical protein